MSLSAVALVCLLAAMLLLVVRALIGPTVQDRILAANGFGTATVLWLCVYGVVDERLDLIDIAIIYALTSFVSTIAVLKYVERGHLGADPREPSGSDGPPRPAAEDAG